jgi:predicted NAD-dependent protein-ADP-ribosyltransferase YbiA (DUF1768 family)
MTICNLEKYKQNAELRKLLFETGDTLLVEATSLDLYWGAGVVSFYFIYHIGIH